MAIYKLSDICEPIRGNCTFQKKDLRNTHELDDYLALHYGKTYKEDIIDDSFNYYVSSNFFKESQVVNYGNTVLVSTSEILCELGHSYYYNTGLKGLLGGEQILLKPYKNIVLDKYLFYLTIGLKQNLQQFATGMKVYRFKPQDFKFITVDIPSLDEQEEIIEIIKPLESAINCLKNTLKLIEIIDEKLMYFNQETNVTFNYTKGSLPNDKSGRILFLNVAAANGNPNRYVSNNANIKLGDVTLSLDGNCGIVNNTLVGFNGYLYKVDCDDYDNWQVYYSLKTQESKRIIKLNETGTTIKHATNAKKALKLRIFEYSRYLEILFDARITLKENLNYLNNQKDRVIKLLIK